MNIEMYTNIRSFNDVPRIHNYELFIVGGENMYIGEYYESSRIGLAYMIYPVNGKYKKEEVDGEIVCRYFDMSDKINNSYLEAAGYYCNKQYKGKSGVEYAREKILGSTNIEKCGALKWDKNL